MRKKKIFSSKMYEAKSGVISFLVWGGRGRFSWHKITNNRPSILMHGHHSDQISHPLFEVVQLTNTQN